ncbi:hypothetical protein HY489_03105 [Candidatus Woesearchaeota archaeon]|nr:hypothetical protein [Candidatus Woesearchaeota archaeon]
MTNIGTTADELFTRRYMMVGGRAVPRVCKAVSKYLFGHSGNSYKDPELADDIRSNFLGEPDPARVRGYLERRLGIKVDYERLQKEFREAGLEF